MQRLVIAPAADDRLGQHTRPRNALLDRERERLGNENFRAETFLIGFASKLLANYLDHHARSWATFDDGARLAADDREGIETFALHFRRHELDVDARPVRRRQLALRLLARVGFDVLLFGRGGRRLVRVAHHQRENGQRELRVVLRQPLRILTVEPALEPFVLFTQQCVELLVLVELLFHRRDARQRLGKNRFRRRRLHLSLDVCCVAHANILCLSRDRLSSGLLVLASISSASFASHPAEQLREPRGVDLDRARRSARRGKLEHRTVRAL
jgi:hypothetical protein